MTGHKIPSYSNFDGVSFGLPVYVKLSVNFVCVVAVVVVVVVVEAIHDKHTVWIKSTWNCSESRLLLMKRKALCWSSPPRKRCFLGKIDSRDIADMFCSSAGTHGIDEFSPRL